MRRCPFVLAPPARPLMHPAVALTCPVPVVPPALPLFTTPVMVPGAATRLPSRASRDLSRRLCPRSLRDRPDAHAKKGQFERCNGVGLPHICTVARDRGHPRSGCGLWTGDRSVCCRLTPRVRAGTQSLCEALHRWICHRPNPPPPSTKPISAFAISAAAIAISTASIAISAARTSNKAKAVITLAAASPRGYVCRRARDALLHGQSLAAQSMAAQRCRAGNGQHSQ